MTSILNFFSTIHILDILIFLVLLYGFYAGYRKGMINIFFGMLSIFGSLFVAKGMFPRAASFFAQSLNVDLPWIKFMLYILLLLTGFIGFRLLGHLFTRLFSKSVFGFYNHMAGLMLNGFKWFCVIGIILLVLVQFQAVEKNTFINKSVIYTFVKSSAEALKLDNHFTPKLKEIFKNFKKA